MTLFKSTFEQMLLLLLLMGIGFFLSRVKLIPRGSAAILSKLENMVFIPALIAGTFSRSFTMDVLTASWETLLVSFLLCLVPIPLCYGIAYFCSKDDFTRRIYIYGLVFSNYGFMGNAVVAALFPDQFVIYLIFTLPQYIVAYLWAFPTLLIPQNGEKGFRRTFRSLCNPMLIGAVIGMLLGISGLKLPVSLDSAMTAAGNCMSPIAMILTGITIAEMPIAKILRIKGVYVLSVFRLLIFPIAFGFLLRLFRLDQTTYLCAVCVLAMPLGLSSVVVPAGYGKDTSVAAGMALVSHLMSVVTIPFVFWLLM